MPTKTTNIRLPTDLIEAVKKTIKGDPLWGERHMEFIRHAIRTELDRYIKGKKEEG